MKRFFFLAGVMAATATITFAAPLDRKDVAKDPALLLHVDVDALKASSVGKAILVDADVQTKLSAIQAMFNFDFRSQLHGFTVYTTSDHSQDPALIVYADFEPDRLITLAKAFPGFNSETNGARVVYDWLDEKKKGSDGVPRIYASIIGHRLIIGKTEEALTGALDVIDGKTDSFKGDKMLLEAASGGLVVVEGCLRKFDMAENNPSAAIFQASKSIRFQLGEKDDNVGATVSFEAKDTDSASQISAMVNGLLALLKFQKDNPDVLKLANAINLRQDGSAVILSLTEPSADLVQMLKHGAEEQKRKQERKEEHDADTNAPATKT